MGVSVGEQLRQMSAGVLAGGGMGLMWSVLHWLVPGKRSWIKTAVDFLWVFLCALGVLILSRELGAGLRLFFLCSCALGASLYFWGLEERARAVPETLRVFISKSFKKMKIHRKEP